MAGCGACNKCCLLLGVPDIKKPAHMLCWHTGLHGGCAVHKEKGSDPTLQACAQFRCMWLESQDLEEEKQFPRSMRPDQCFVMFGPSKSPDDTLLFVHVDPARPDAWKEPAIQNYLAGVLERGGQLKIIIGDKEIELNNVTGASACA